MVDVEDFLLWMRNRLINQYGESPGVDFVQALEILSGRWAKMQQENRELKEELDTLRESCGWWLEYTDEIEPEGV